MIPERKSIDIYILNGIAVVMLWDGQLPVLNGFFQIPANFSIK